MAKIVVDQFVEIELPNNEPVNRCERRENANAGPLDGVFTDQKDARRTFGELT
jgi:hypothetical protein